MRPAHQGDPPLDPTALLADLRVLADQHGIDRLGVTDRRTRGLAMGAVSHGIGTSRSLHDDLTEGAFAGLAMGLTALATSLLAPFAAALL